MAIITSDLFSFLFYFFSNRFIVPGKNFILRTGPQIQSGRSLVSPITVAPLLLKQGHLGWQVGAVFCSIRRCLRLLLLFPSLADYIASFVTLQQGGNCHFSSRLIFLCLITKVYGVFISRVLPLILIGKQEEWQKPGLFCRNGPMIHKEVFHSCF